MAHDIVIRNGQIVDGLLNPACAGDVAINGDTITEIGQVGGKGYREIDASGAVVTPGFIDLHTHMDAQIGWDPQLTPASWHGITTVLMGNCGVTFAPVRPQDKELLAGMMESVEDIPRQAIMEGLPWDWSSFGEYLDSIEKRAPALNVAALVGHAATRFYVMGERAVEEDPTEQDIKDIAALAGQSVREGAVGFSINRLKAHRLPDGRCIPGTLAPDAELVAIAREVGAAGGFLQSVIEAQPLEEEMRVMRLQLEAAGTHMLFSAPWIPGDNGASAYQPAIDAMRAAGLEVTGTTQPRAAGFLSGLNTNILFGMRFKGEGWRKLRNTPVPERLALIQDTSFRAQLVAEAKQVEIAEHVGQTLSSSAYSLPARRCFWMGTAARPDYTKVGKQSLAGMAKQAGEHPVETWLRLQLESNGEGFFHMRFVNEDLEALPAYMGSDWVVPGVGDAGAHVSMVMDAGWSSFFISHWYRDKGVYTLEETIHMLTAKQNRVLQLGNRGALRVGWKADINVLDIDRIEERQPLRVNDFPGGAPRLIQRAVGYRHTLVNGAVVLENDELTEARAGQVLRNGR
ncbi:MAG: amidohydrolase family protein [Pseudomonadota bacterium]